MDPIALAGILATAYGLGLLPQTKHDELLSGIIGYSVGHMGKGDLEKQLRSQEDRHRHDMRGARDQHQHEIHDARRRELELVRMLNQSEETRRTQLQLSEALRNAAIASRK